MTNSNATKKKIIYSLRVYIELRIRGFNPIIVIPNPNHNGLKCWVYEWDQDIEEAFLDIVRGGQENG